MTQADKLAAIYAAKLNIREAIKSKGVAITNDEPFSGYAVKILLIECDGSGSGSGEKNVTQGFGVTDIAAFAFIPMEEYGTSEVFAIYGKTSESAVDGAIILYPPTNEYGKTEIADISRFLGIAPVETAELVFSLWAFAESFNLRTANKYSYDVDWVEFTESGAYVRDRIFKANGDIESLTENGAVFSVPLPNRKSYGGLNSLSAKLGGVNDDD